MNRQRHLAEAELRFRQADALLNAAGPADLTGAGESIWATMVHAASAADPGHELQPPDRFSNPHTGPVSYNVFREAAARISHSTIKPNRIADYLTTGQSGLHDHFYHLDLTPTDQATCLNDGIQHAEELLNIARQRHQAT